MCAQEARPLRTETMILLVINGTGPPALADVLTVGSPGKKTKLWSAMLAGFCAVNALTSASTIVASFNNKLLGFWKNWLLSQNK